MRFLAISFSILPRKIRLSFECPVHVQMICAELATRFCQSRLLVGGSVASVRRR